MTFELEIATQECVLHQIEKLLDSLFELIVLSSQILYLLILTYQFLSQDDSLSISRHGLQLAEISL